MQIYEEVYNEDLKRYGLYDDDGSPFLHPSEDGKTEPLGLSTPLR